MAKDKAAGRRMRLLFDRAKVERGFHYDQPLWDHLGVERCTAQAWMRGNNPPSHIKGAQVAAQLGMTYAQLIAVYEGRTDDAIDPRQLVAAFEWAIAQVRSEKLSPGAAAEARPSAAPAAHEPDTRGCPTPWLRPSRARP